MVFTGVGEYGSIGGWEDGRMRLWESMGVLGFYFLGGHGSPI